jgi:hypothetical protein
LISHRYLPTATFHPRFIKPTADRCPARLKAVADGILAPDETQLDGLPGVRGLANWLDRPEPIAQQCHD